MNKLREWLDDTKNWWAGSALVMGMFVLGQAAWLWRWTIGGWPRPMVLAALCGIVFGLAVFARRPWARWVGIPWIVFWLLGQGMNSTFDGWPLSAMLAMAVLVVMALAYFFIFLRNAASLADEDDNKPFLSLVLLLREPRYLDATILASLATRAWEIDVSAGDASSGESDEDAGSLPNEADEAAFLVGEAPIFMAKHPQALLVIHDFDRPYFDDPEKAAAEMIELRCRKAIAEHAAWIAVDVLHWWGEGDALGQSYRLIARLLAELADDNVLAVIDPDASKIFPYDPELETKLQSDDPLAALRSGGYAPVIGIEADDPAMQAAVAEARRRWPEFVAAFEHRSLDGSGHYTVKAPLGDCEHVEYMWMEVTSIENGVIYGILGNEPANIPSLKEGDRVRTTVAELNDWLVIADGDPVGGFTIKVVMERAGKHLKGEG